jgi:hypothetical protein
MYFFPIPICIDQNTYRLETRTVYLYVRNVRDPTAGWSECMILLPKDLYGISQYLKCNAMGV